MPTVKIPLFDTAYTNTQGVVLNDKLSYFINGYVDQIGGYHRFPGVSSLYDTGFGTGTKIDGVYYWQQRNMVIFVTLGRIFKLEYSGGTTTITELTGAALLSGRQVKFAIDGNNLFMANGAQIVSTDGTTVAYMTDPDVPINVIDVAFLDGYVIAFTSGTKWHWSNVNSSFVWSALNFASAPANPDNIYAGKIYNREIYIFGPLTIEIWQNDGETPFSRVPGGALEIGCIAPDSIIKRDEGFYFLDNKRRFVSLNGRSPNFIECPYQKEIQGLAVVSDCAGMAIEEAGQSFLIFTFISADRTFLYNLKTEKWSELGKWNLIDSTYQRWIGNCYTYANDWNMHIVGSASAGKVYALSQSYSTDDGDIIRDCRRSGDIDYGTSKEKRSEEIRIRLKRGEGGSTTPTLMFRYRTNGRYWSPVKTINLGASGEYDIFRRIQARGFFRSRQYEISATDGVEIVQADAEEDIMVGK